MRKRISPKHLQPGLSLPGHLYASSGQVIVKAGTVLGADHLIYLTEYASDGLFGGPDWPESATFYPPELEHAEVDAGKSISIDALHAGMRLTKDIYDAKTDVLLLAAGLQVTSRFLRLLATRGIKALRVRSKCTDTIEPADHGVEAVPDQARALDALLEDELKKRIVFRQFSSIERPRLSLDDLKSEAATGVEEHAATGEVVADVCAHLARGRDVAGSTISHTLQGFVARATLDIDLLPLIVSLQEAGDEYLFDHCVNVALLSMSMAAQAGLTQDKITEIGFGALLQDIGMVRVPKDIRLAQRTLTTAERAEVNKHPLYTIEWLANIDLTPVTTALIGYQSHERADGSGYPRNRLETRIHPFARIVGVADVFAAMTCDRPYRAALRPYEASREILASVLKFDRPTAALFLDTVGLFPIGSLVELSNGNSGRVVRIVPGAHTQPVVERVDRHGRPTGRLINLAVEKELKILRAFHRHVDPSSHTATAGSSHLAH